MKYLHLVWAGIWRKPGRAVLTLLSIITAFLLFGVLQGFMSGLNSTVANSHADVMMVQNRVSQLEPLPMSMLAQIKSVPGVTAVTPLIVFHGAFRTTQPINMRAFAVDPDAFAAAVSDEHIPPAMVEAWKHSRTGVILPAVVAAQYNLKVGDRMAFRSGFWTNRDGTTNWPLDVVGIYKSNPKDVLFGAAVLANYDYVDQGRAQSNGTTNVFILRIADPLRAGAVAADIDHRFANSANETKTVSEQQLLADSIKQLGDIGFIVNSVVGAVFFALLFSVGAVMMQSMRERTPELAVLKTLGFTDGAILWLILAESLLLCLTAAAIGVGLASLLFPAIKASGLAIQVRPDSLMLQGLVIAAGLAVVSGLPPAIRGMRLQIVDALAGR